MSAPGCRRRGVGADSQVRGRQRAMSRDGGRAWASHRASTALSCSRTKQVGTCVGAPNCVSCETCAVPSLKETIPHRHKRGGATGCPKGRVLAARTRRPRKRRCPSVYSTSPCMVRRRNAGSGLEVGVDADRTRLLGDWSGCASRLPSVPPGRSRRHVGVPARPVKNAGCTCATQPGQRVLRSIE